MTDSDEPQASGSDYSDAQELISHQQKEPCEVYSWQTNTGTEHSGARPKVADPGESSDHPNSMYKSATASADVLLISSDSETDVSVAHPECSIAPSKQKRRSQSSRQQIESVAGVPDNESSSDSSLSPQSPGKSLETSKQQKSKLNLKAIFARHFRGRKFKAAAHRKYKTRALKNKKKCESTQVPTGRPPLTASPQEQKRRLLDRGFQFPFVEKHYGEKHVPLKMVLDYEQAAAKGYFKYIEVLKYEDHLKKALKTLQASDDLEKECLVFRKHKYLDDEGPISPIQETGDDDSLNSDTQEQFDARVVENSSFILSSTVPSKKKSKPGRKHAKPPEVIEIVDEEDNAEESSVPVQGSAL
ncbi:PREDICTED: TATA box-binding protein-associated factor RNA polymerase I subunit D [Sturnus vulgaris]|uniref:TATA box-binding protein-associated factor RNA polymerase I subunit D n=1 Tax=Sturnus vulgaris TaxID=9172 RepID=UPI00071A6A2B|nr:PREDICTED: TATA box-binding protein-associated factor RNA polymerase I subunit D [Sturnus vulgaris]XP_014733008.1 PREDICTED: TATA box-binding protein-associated factor RNA polymerase I subunit D [Sturnus vulgaris]XP_014733009.1 PREDICTED: TATA box-binding protein-associated factor RNA polymerase I subunit D [Sturnus vulgaris]XP_014733011.1 PREDICTED: TATA box-binding protein-associated factor RNA polymerase I subunit D [Sturnus vulgaris]XP_014733012.1 PREDICTED: TATA box-binding protein-asso